MLSTSTGQSDTAAGRAIYDELDEATQKALTEAMKAVEGEVAKAQLVPDPPGGADNVGMQEARGYGLFLEGDPSGALEVLGRVARYDANYPWEQHLAAPAPLRCGV